MVGSMNQDASQEAGHDDFDLPKPAKARQISAVLTEPF
jgi:hypothetical protein